MPRQLALLIYLSGVVWLFRRDFREKPNITGALWLPFFWVVISGSRFVSQWLAIFGLNLGGTSVEEGSPLDAFIFFVLILSGLYVLNQRRLNLSEFIQNNRLVTIYLAYCFLAIMWSDYPFVSFKRWIKLFGQPVMVLILLTEPDPVESLTRLLKRCAYVVIPISILFIKYFPELGSAYDSWTGSRMNTGITKDKNLLGCDCMILGLFFFWHFLRVRRRGKSVTRRNELIFCLVFLMLIGWLLDMAQSATSIGSLLLAIAVVLFLGIRFVNLRLIGAYLVAVLVICGLAEVLFGISEQALHFLGRNSTLTGRTDIWKFLLNWDINPILGSGFESFWLTSGLGKADAMFQGLTVNEAHNGYLETYLNLGLLGLFITLAMLLTAFFKARYALLTDFQFGRFRLAYLAAFIIYNWTEAAFRTHCFSFFMFFLIAIDYPKPPLVNAEQTVHADSTETDVKLVSMVEQVPLAYNQSASNDLNHTKSTVQADWKSWLLSIISRPAAITAGKPT
jgi:O-antigen ligase